MSDYLRRFGILLALLFAFCPLVGCERDVMEADTPGGGEVEVEEELGGDLELEVEED